MRPNVRPDGPPLYECHDCGVRLDDPETRSCPDCDGTVLNIGRSRDL